MSEYNKIYLGRVAAGAKLPEDSFLSRGEKLWIERHKWDCGWYWGFGYIGNANLHTHFDGTFLRGGAALASDIFDSTPITDREWWVIRDLMVQAYALKKAAEVYRYGGHQTSRTGVTDIIRDADMVTRLNADLKYVLDTLWAGLMRINERRIAAGSSERAREAGEKSPAFVAVPAAPVDGGENVNN